MSLLPPKLVRLQNALTRIERRIGPTTLRDAAQLHWLMFKARDPLAQRAMWRRQGRPLQQRATCVGGKLERFLAP